VGLVKESGLGGAIPVDLDAVEWSIAPLMMAGQPLIRPSVGFVSVRRGARRD
jgi:hypothetical protein